MSLHAESLKQARFLARKEREKPTQASLRRSVSASYYAIFHFLVDEVTRLVLAGNVRAPLRESLARHARLQTVTDRFQFAEDMEPFLSALQVRTFDILTFKCLFYNSLSSSGLSMVAPVRHEDLYTYFFVRS